jgi:hypothetical protein
MTTLSKEVTEQILWLIISVNYDYSRIVIAEHEFNDQALTLYLEDKQDFKNTVDECLNITVPIAEFEAFIEKGNYNKYEGRKQSESGRPYNGLITVSEPFEWYCNDATQYQQRTVREALVEAILKQVSA